MKLNKKIIIIAVLFALITTYGVYYYISSLEAEVSSIRYEKVWVAKDNIPPKTKIEKGMIEEKEIQADYVMTNVIRDSNSIIGKYTNDRLIKGEQIISDKILEIDKAKFSYQIPEKTRAITITVNDISGVSNLIKPGDYVDVLVFVPEITEENDTTTTIYPDIAKLVLQNILVLAVDQDYGQTDKEVVPQETRKITLAVDPFDTEKLLLSDETLKIRLALRNPEEQTKYDTPGIIRKDIIPEKGKRVLKK